jgi:glycosyltransferase involved in cell wall biosynthesis
VLADVRLAIGSCDVIVVPSHNETFSIAALEAMALGKPLIMADVGGASEQVEHSGNGYLYPKADVAALSDRILRMADPGCRSAFGAASLRKVIHEFSLTRMVDAYVRELIDLARD